MKKVAVTGATGFVGDHVVRTILASNSAVKVIATSRSREKASQFPWFDKVVYVPCDLRAADEDYFRLLNQPHTLIHLAWERLHDYDATFQFEENLRAGYRFVRNMIDGGVRRVLVAGTCFEYGLQEGCLVEDAPGRPVTNYGFAKDTLRQMLERLLAGRGGVSFCWARLFYLYGKGQKGNSFLALLDKAIEDAEEVFNMSAGEQLRDYLPVEKAAAYLTSLAANDDATGIVNVCSGNPVSLRRLAEEHIARKGASITLNLGCYPYPDYEPMAFWGSGERLRELCHCSLSQGSLS